MPAASSAGTPGCACTRRATTRSPSSPVTTWADLARGSWPTPTRSSTSPVSTVARTTRCATATSRLADDVARCRASARAVRCASSTRTRSRHGNGTPYGTGKARRGRRPRRPARRRRPVVDVRLPNLFGEHGRPGYNSFVATFVHAVAAGETPRGRRSRGRAPARAGCRPGAHRRTGHDAERLEPAWRRASACRRSWTSCTSSRRRYATGEFPDLSTPVPGRPLQHLPRGALPAALPDRAACRTPMPEAPSSRRCAAAAARASRASRRPCPGVTRGEHYHLREDRAVRGRRRAARRSRCGGCSTTTSSSSRSTGDAPCAVDMPTGWAHNITNTGDDVLVTQFWSHELFRPEAARHVPRARPARRSHA